MLEGFQEAAGETPHVYYQPPENLKIVYPCFVYSDSDVEVLYANDMPYLQYQEYVVTYMTRKASPPLVDAILRLPRVRFDRHYTSENIHHYAFVMRTKLADPDPAVDLTEAAKEFLGGTND